MAEVFISYKRAERALVAPISAGFKELGVDAWFDMEISAGENFDTKIHEKLREAKAVLVCWSPQAIESDWVKSEAAYARQRHTCVPVFIADCELMPPFNLIQTEDLSKWTGEANDPAWIKVVERIAKLISREGVAAAARAFATGDDQARYDFARRYPDEPTAAKIWNAHEARHREHFQQRMVEATAATESRINAERATLQARLRAAAPTFEIWLADERRATAKGPPPDPLELIGPAQAGEEQRLRDEIAALQSSLARAAAEEGDLNAAKAKIAQLSGELAALNTAMTHAKAREGELDSAKAEIVRLSKELSALKPLTGEPESTIIEGSKRQFTQHPGGQPGEAAPDPRPPEFGGKPTAGMAEPKRQIGERSPLQSLAFALGLAVIAIIAALCAVLGLGAVNSKDTGAGSFLFVVSGVLVYLFYRRIKTKT